MAEAARAPLQRHLAAGGRRRGDPRGLGGRGRRRQRGVHRVGQGASQGAGRLRRARVRAAVGRRRLPVRAVARGREALVAAQRGQRRGACCMGRVDQAADPVLAGRLQAARQVDRLSAAAGREAPRGAGCAAHGAPPRRGGGAASYERGVRPRQPIAGRPARPLPRLVPHASTLCRGGAGWREWAVGGAGLHAAPARPPRVGRARPAAVRGGRARRGAAAHARGAGEDGGRPERRLADEGDAL
mmetsp:Transcript_37004/g.110244  ORF Transcript_37004/g.110244 Transcript_37004/m.110244 type:complete len:243 (+) Transcript_37004:402-1130(+)